jgi:replicative DNA helicase
LPEAEVIMLAHRLGDGSPEGGIPASLFSARRTQVALFLRHLWGGEGSVWWDAKAGQSHIFYASTSRRLIDDVARLLLRFNVMTEISEFLRSDSRPCYRLRIDGAENQLRFLDGIGVHGTGRRVAETMREGLRSVKDNTATIPGHVWERVRGVLEGRQVASGQTAGERAASSATNTASDYGSEGRGLARTTSMDRTPRREQLAGVATILGDADLEMVATNDVFWDEIASVESLGEQPVYDATVPGTHNFVANGISLHNSIEQDSDVVILLHREDMYERESPRAGEADLIVAKHRNGPTATVTVAFQGHYSRFVDMAPG